MLNMKQYAAPESLKEAWEMYNSSPRNVILGGCAFLRMGHKTIGTGIDLTKLGLNYIRENSEGNRAYIEIGAMTHLRDLETNPLLKTFAGGMLSQSVAHIVGVSFRNTVTVGGSVFGRYGFSDILTALLALRAEVEFYNKGIISLESYLEGPPIKDILISVRIPAEVESGCYEAFRHSKGDYPILTTAVAKLDGDWNIAVGARPMRAMYADQAMDYLNSMEPSSVDSKTMQTVAEMVSNELTFGTNMRGQAAYRAHLCKVLVARCLNTCESEA